MAAFPCLATAGEWFYVGSDDQSHFAIELNSIRNQGDSRSFWYVMAYQETADYEGDIHDYSVNRALIHCSNETIENTSLTYYAIDQSGPIYSVTFDTPSPNAIIPDTVGYALWAFVCNPRNETEDTIESARLFAIAARATHTAEH